MLDDSRYPWGDARLTKEIGVPNGEGPAGGWRAWRVAPWYFHTARQTAEGTLPVRVPPCKHPDFKNEEASLFYSAQP